MNRDQYEGGYMTYGRGLGVLMLDTTTPRPPGDVGNARSYDYSVFFETVEGASPERVVREQDPTLIEPFINGARRLEERGAVAITTGCGFLLMFQDRLADAVDVPVFTSSLLQIPQVAAMISSDESIGVVTADERTIDLIDHHVLTAYEDRIVVDGLAEADHFQEVYITMDENVLRPDRANEEVLSAVQRLVEREQLGALLFECTNLRPYVEDVRRETDLPVFDYLTLADMAWRAAHATRY
jgi:Asp/Glu/hydantoin racemase